MNNRQMNNRIKVIMIFFMLSFITSSAQAETVGSLQPAAVNTEYSLEELYKLTLENSERVKLSREDLYIAEKGKDKAISALLPRVSAFGALTRYSETKLSTTGAVLQPENSNYWGFKIDRSFSLSGRELTALEMSNKNIAKSGFELHSAREAALINTAAAYHDLLRTKKSVEIARANVERLTRHRDAAQVRLTVGEVTKTALLRAQAELSGALSELVRTENNLKFANAVLARITGLPGTFEVKEPAGSEEIESIDHLKQKAQAERPELKALGLQKKIAEDQIKYIRGTYWPTVTIEGMYLRKHEDPASAYLIKDSLYAGLKLEFPFYEGGLRKAEVSEAAAKARQAELLFSELKQNIDLEVMDAHRVLMTQKGTLKALEDQFAFARDNYKAVSKQFEHGIASSIDVMDANTLLVTAERQLADAISTYHFSVQLLKKATGALLNTIIK